MIEIRALRQDDLQALGALAAKTFRETFSEGFSPEEIEETIAATKSAEYFSSVIDQDVILVAVDTAVEGARLAGYVHLSDVKVKMVEGMQPAAEDQAINAIYVAADYQGQGVGRQLMDAAFAHERFATANNIFIDVWEENARAVNFYLSYGFKPAGKCAVTSGDKVVGYDLVLKRPVEGINE